MNTLKFNQKQGFVHNEFILSDSTLSIQQSTISEIKSWTVRLEDIGHRITVEKDTSLIKHSITLFLWLFSILFVIGNIADHSNHLKTWQWMALSFLWYWFATIVFLSPFNNKLILGQGPDAIEFLSDRPSEEAVREFVDEIIKRSALEIQRKYGFDSE
jgi:hypothetical protein